MGQVLHFWSAGQILGLQTKSGIQQPIRQVPLDAFFIPGSQLESRLS